MLVIDESRVYNHTGIQSIYQSVYYLPYLSSGSLSSINPKADKAFNIF